MHAIVESFILYHKRVSKKKKKSHTSGVEAEVGLGEREKGGVGGGFVRANNCILFVINICVSNTHSELRDSVMIFLVPIFGLLNRLTL